MLLRVFKWYLRIAKDNWYAKISSYANLVRQGELGDKSLSLLGQCILKILSLKLGSFLWYLKILVFKNYFGGAYM